jgi:hypothetical protein
MVSLMVAIVVTAHGMSDKFKPNGQGRIASEQRSLLLQREVRHGLQIERDGFLKGAEHLFEPVSLDRDVEIEADRLPIAIPALRVAVERPAHLFLTPRHQLHLRIAEVYRLKVLSSIWQRVQAR